MTPGKNIQKRRKALGLTQAECARKYGCTQSCWADYERDRASPSVDTIGKIAVALKCKPRDLL